ncbi:FAD binding domain-containing protein [Actinokineospora alba]|uniref:FAD binding domain-containing protein n=1 Tax=Actinokineospora alba TaxID=504798 RepID=A0A1H0HC49_9PSEU|nr:FAD-dependent oxidoreductase [Actinokineospora alba]TDP64945.1 FAD binding domain-containing protein [Actinokineospora alba]SDH49977.1 FAD binding domain-containing protein [Actinokineospora alba]SDO16708.1 FAD binding domain-containing protein [Actinokineospora alba]
MNISRLGEAAYDAATQVFNLSAPARPAAAVTARSIVDIRAALDFARANGLPVRMHTTGHAAAGTRPMDGSVLIRTELGGGVEVDAARRIARIPAGTRWGAVVEATAPHGLTAPHGSSPSVGAVGYLLRGGMSFYGRKVGLAANSVRAIELVTANGDELRVDAQNDPELFWALRGGGGGLGVVTAIEVELFPVAAVITGGAYWRAEHAERLLNIWLRWTDDAPREATTSVRMLNLPAVDGVPPQLAGPTFSVDGAVMSTTEDVTEAQRIADDLLGPLRAVAEPVMDTWATTGPAAVLHAHMDPTDPVPFVGDHMLLGALGEDGAAEMLRVLGPESDSPLVVAGLRQLGGAFAEPDPAGGALSHLAARYSYAGSGVLFDPVTPDLLRGHCTKVREALAPWDTGRTVPGFVEDVERPQRHLDAAAIAAVDDVRVKVDPDGLFRGDIAPNASGLY